MPIRAEVREAFLPRDGVALAVLLLVALRPIVIYLAARLFLDEPAAVTAIYRPGGDFQYYEIIGPLARGVLGEGQLLERGGAGLLPFPVVGLALHTLLYAGLGIWGLVLADAAWSWIFFAGACFLFRVCDLPGRRAALLAGVIGTSLTAALDPLAARVGLAPLLLWGDRLPRPFATTAVLLWSLALSAALWRRRDQRPSFYVASGLVLALVVDANIYSATVAMLVLGVTLAWRLAAGPRRGELVRGALVLGVALAAGSVPFIVQRGAVSPELLRRWGAYAVARGSAPAMLAELPLAAPLVALAAAALALVARRRTDLVGPALVATGCALLALPLFSLVTGMAIQPFHFADELKRVALTAAALLVATMLPAWRGRLVAAALCVAMAGAVGARAWQATRRSEHPRPGLYSVPGYRPAFAGLVRELERPGYADARVLATFDQAVQAWWNGLHGGWSYLPDGFVTLAPDGEIEARLVALARLVGADLDRLVDLPAVSILYHGVLKYDTSRWHALAPMDDYPPAERPGILRRGLMTSFHNVLPVSERRRLHELGGAPPAARLDLIVLGNDAPWRDLAPPPDRFELAYRDATFRVYRARRP